MGKYIILLENNQAHTTYRTTDSVKLNTVMLV